MRKLETLFCIAWLAGCGGVPPDSSESESPLVGAFPAAANQLLAEVKVSTTGVGWCTGTLVARNRVLTAGHCVCNSPSDCKPRSTVYFRNEPGVATPPPPINGNAVHHPGFNPVTTAIQNDLAIIVLDSDAPPYIQPVGVAAGHPAIGSNVLLAGDGDYGVNDCNTSGGELRYRYNGVSEYEDGYNIMDFYNDPLCHGDSGGAVMDAAATEVNAVHSGSWWAIFHGLVSKSTTTGAYYNWIKSNTCASSCSATGPVCRCAEQTWATGIADFVGSTGNLYMSTRTGGGEFCNPASDGASVLRMSKDTLATPSTLYKAPDCAHDFVAIARDGAYAVVLDAGRSRVARVPLAGGALVDLATTASIGYGFGKRIAVDSSVSPSQVYWADAAGVKRVSMNGGAVTTLATTTANGSARAIAVGGVFVFYTTGPSLMRVPKTGGTALQVAATNNSGALYLYTDSQVYWLEQTPFKVRSLTGSFVDDEWVGDNSRAGTSVWYDGTYIYVFDSTVGGTDYRFWRIHPSVEVPYQIATGDVLGAHGLELDATRIWWVDGQGLKKATK